MNGPHLQPGEICDIVIIGASGGIGQYLVRSFCDRHRVVGTYFRRSQDELIEGAKYHHLDVTSCQQVESFCSATASAMMRPVIIYASGISPNGVLHKITDKDWDSTISINLTGAMAVTRGFLPRMRKLGYGRFIYLSSVLGRRANPGTAAYSASKAGLNSLAGSVSVENAKRGITANSLALGYFDIGIIDAVPEQFLHETVIPSIPQGRLGSPGNITSAVEFIIKADYLAGAVIDVNGGII